MERVKSMKFRVWFIAALIIALVAVALVSCRDDDEGQDAAEDSQAVAEALSGDAASIAAARNLTPDDITAALKTYTPSGVYDEYVMFASGGHSGQVFVIGMPSMRMLKTIAVFTPEPWQGYGFRPTLLQQRAGG